MKDYNDFTSSFESRVLVSGRKLRDLNVETGGRELEELEPVGVIAREPAAPEAGAETGIRALLAFTARPLSGGIGRSARS